MIKLSATIIVYNGAQYLDYCIKSALQWCDHIYIAEGALKPYIEMGLPHRSNDGTLEILEKYKKTAPNIVTIAHTERPLSHHPLQYQMGLDWAKQVGADWHVIIDADEIYPSTTQTVVRKMLERYKNSNKYSGRVYSYNFINDFWHYYSGKYIRIARVTPDATFVSSSMSADNQVEWPEMSLPSDIMHGPIPSHVFEIPSSARFFHYSYVKSRVHIEKKLEFVHRKDGNPLKGYNITDDGLFELPPDMPIYQFRGRHPKVMRDHPLCYMTKDF